MSYELGIQVTPDCLEETNKATIDFNPDSPKPALPPKVPVQRINGFKWDDIPDQVKMDLVTKTKRKFLTRTSLCPCGSQKRFKRCCMLK